MKQNIINSIILGLVLTVLASFYPLGNSDPCTPSTNGRTIAVDCITVHNYGIPFVSVKNIQGWTSSPGYQINLGGLVSDFAVWLFAGTLVIFGSDILRRKRG